MKAGDFAQEFALSLGRGSLTVDGLTLEANSMMSKSASDEIRRQSHQECC